MLSLIWIQVQRLQVVSLTLEIAAGVLIYFTAVLLMRVEEAINIKNKFISKFSGLIRRKALDFSVLETKIKISTQIIQKILTIWFAIV